MVQPMSFLAAVAPAVQLPAVPRVRIPATLLAVVPRRAPAPALRIFVTVTLIAHPPVWTRRPVSRPKNPPPRYRAARPVRVRREPRARRPRRVAPRQRPALPVLVGLRAPPRRRVRLPHRVRPK